MIFDFELYLFFHFHLSRKNWQNIFLDCQHYDNNNKHDPAKDPNTLNPKSYHQHFSTRLVTKNFIRQDYKQVVFPLAKIRLNVQSVNDTSKITLITKHFLLKFVKTKLFCNISEKAKLVIAKTDKSKWLIHRYQKQLYP